MAREWAPFLYIHKTRAWEYINNPGDWESLKKYLDPDPNVREDIFKEKQGYIGHEDIDVPTFSHYTPEKNRGTRTLLDFFNENGMDW